MDPVMMNILSDSVEVAGMHKYLKAQDVTVDISIPIFCNDKYLLVVAKLL